MASVSGRRYAALEIAIERGIDEAESGFDNIYLSYDGQSYWTTCEPEEDGRSIEIRDYDTPASVKQRWMNRGFLVANG